MYREYYAARNGFSGFKSYFNEVFDKSSLSHIYILKGGPGTGKSTLMRKISKHFFDKGFNIDAIFCSSDTKSLDGVIIDGKVAIIDGTAPHEMDTRLPGAFDEIINLGDSWNAESLKKSREKIEELNLTKKENYSSAYKYLAFSKNIHDYKQELLRKEFDFDYVENFISKTLSSFKKSIKKPKSMLISSFSKDGYTRRNLYSFDIQKSYSIVGSLGTDELFFEALMGLALGNFKLTFFISPFSEEITDGIYFEEEKALFLRSQCEGEVINTDRFLKTESLDEIEFLNKILDSYLEKSKLYFKKASEAHFSLEDIYKESMDFKLNEEIFNVLSEKIEKILSL